MRQKKLYIALAVFLIFSLLLNACSSPSTKSPAAPPRGITGTITTGKEVTAASASINPSGGTITVTDQSSPLAGLEIVVPPDSYSKATPFTVSYSPIEQHTFGKDFNPVSPLITIDNGGSYSEEMMEVKVPVKIPPGHFAMGFLYDDKTGQLEGLPLVAQDADSITIATKHFSTIVAGSIDPALLQDDIDSGFTPGVDDWQFTNRGSYLEPKGHCAGQSLAAMWYYFARPDGKDNHLFGQYDNNGDAPATPDFWRDDSLGYRFSSVVQNDADWDGEAYKFFIENAKDPKKTWEAFTYSMKLPGHRPQLVAIFNTQNHTGHALVAYKISGNKLYVADPNYPGKTDRFIEFVNGKFKPYNSGANAEEIAAGNGREYDLIAYAGMTAVVDWKKIGRRWEEVNKGTIGDDSFPSYQVEWNDDQNSWHKLEDGYESSSKLLKLGIGAVGGISGDDIRFYVYRDGNNSASNPDARFAGGMAFELKPGNNLLGILVHGVTADQKEKYIDFKYINVIYKEPATKVWTLVETKRMPLGDKPVPTFTFGAPWGSEITLKDGTATRRMYDSDKQSWTVTLTYTFDKPPASLKSGDVLTFNSSVTGSYSGKPPFKDEQTFEDFSYQAGHWADDTSSIDDIWRQPVQAVGIRMSEMVSGGPVTKSNVTSLTVPESHSGDIGIMATSGLSFSVWWIYRVK